MNKYPKSAHFMNDRRGAILVIGLFFGLALISGLWMLMGISKSTLYRMRVQEASDAVALSAAIVHARGMNFIAACNLCMVALVSFWRVMSIFDQFLLRAMIFIQWPGSKIASCEMRNFVTLPFGVDDCAAQAEVVATEKRTRSILQDYGNTMQKTLRALSDQQAAMASEGTPLGAQIVAQYVAAKYEIKGEAFSATMLPSYWVDGRPPPPPGRPVSWLGLPIDAVPYATLCKRTHGLPWPFALQKVQRYTPLLNQLLGGGQSDIVEAANFYSTLNLEDDLSIFCSTPFWSSSGPKIMAKKGYNGADWMQVWGLVAGSYRDPWAKIVSLPAGRGTPTEKSTASIERTYFSEAEFYFDCTGTWASPSCNGPPDMALALYSMRWRARLRHVQTTAFGKDIVTATPKMIPFIGVGWPFEGSSPSKIFH